MKDFRGKNNNNKKRKEIKLKLKSLKAEKIWKKSS
jgi:hypothetical protein